MIYFDMSKNTNTVVYFDWKTVIYIYVCGKCRTIYAANGKVSHITGACANDIIPSINRSFVYKAKEGGHVRITNKLFFLSYECINKSKTNSMMLSCILFPV